MTDETPAAGRDKGWREKLYLQGWRLWVLVAVVAYTLLGFFFLPWLARDQAPKLARDTLELDVSIERVRVNPYLMTVSVEGLSAHDPQTGPVLEFDRLFVDFELASIWKRAWTFREIRLEAPHAHLERFEDGGTNIQRILDRLPESEEAEPPAEDQRPPRVILTSVSLTDGRADLVDRTRPGPWSLKLGPVSFTLDGFGTLIGQEGAYALDVATARGGHIVWNGSLAVAPLRSTGTLGLRNVDVVTLYSYLRESFDLDVNEALLNVSFVYSVDASGDEFGFSLTSGNVDVGDFALLRRSSGETLLEVPQLSAAGIDFDLQTLALEVGAVEIIEPGLSLRRLEDGRLDLVAALTPVPTQDAGQAPALEGPGDTAPSSDAEPADAAALPSEDGTSEAGATGPESPAAATGAGAQSAASAGAAPSAGGIAGQPEAPPTEADSAAGQASESRTPAPPNPAAEADTDSSGEDADRSAGQEDSPQPGNASAEASAEAATPEASDPGAALSAESGSRADRTPEFTARVAALNIRDGRVSFEDRAAPRPVTTALENITVDVSDYSSADGHQADLALSADVATGGTLAASGQVRAEPLDVGLDVEAADVSLLPFLPYADGAANLEILSFKAGGQGRITITDGEPFGFEGNLVTREFSSRLPDEDTELIAWQRLDADAVRVSLASNSVRVGQATLGQPFIRVRVNEQGELNLTRIAPSRDETPPRKQSDADAASGETLAIGVGQVQIIQGQMDFQDRNLPLPFEALVDSMKGSVSAITSGSPTPARVEIDGDVNEYGAATIRGTLDLFDPTRLMDLEIDFRNIEMPDLTPYTAKFAGREIAGGKLDVDLSWSVRRSQLEAKNRMVIQDLELGENVESPGAMDLPLDLAVALLTDSQGRIDLDVPVSGDLDNPEFGYASLVFNALGNLLGKIVTAPFRFLASLVGGEGVGEADLEFVGFVAGDAKLLGPEQQDLDNLAIALGQRPELGLTIGAAYDPERDVAAIRQDRLDERVAERFEVAAAQADDGRDPVRSILEEMYVETAGPDAVAVLQAEHTATPEDGKEPVLDESSYLESLRNALLAAEPVSTEELEQLALERAEAVRSHLVEKTGVDAARLDTGEPGESSRTDENLVYLKLDVSVE